MSISLGLDRFRTCLVGVGGERAAVALVPQRCVAASGGAGEGEGEAQWPWGQFPSGHGSRGVPAARVLERMGLGVGACVRPPAVRLYVRYEQPSGRDLQCLRMIAS